jgi:hypothetical protein
MAKRLTKEEVICRCLEKHGNKYDYSKVTFERLKDKVIIGCPIHGFFEQKIESHIEGYGCRKCGYISKHKVYGVGIADIKCNEYKCSKVWHSMLQRCYDSKYHNRYPTYKDCTVCDEWLLLSNFKKWFDENYIEGYVLDKDILFTGNKVYSPETCCFVPHEVNEMIHSIKKRELPLGVHFHKNRYCACLNTKSKRIYLGRYKTKEEASEIYLAYKKEYMLEIICNLYNEKKISERIYNAIIKRIENEEL